MAQKELETRAVTDQSVAVSRVCEEKFPEPKECHDEFTLEYEWNREMGLKVLNSKGMFDAMEQLRSYQPSKFEEGTFRRDLRTALLEFLNPNSKKDFYQVFSYGRALPHLRNSKKERAKLTITTMWNQIRAPLLDGIYTDVDISNAHPNIIAQLLTAYNIPCIWLKDYIANREVCLQRVIDHYQLKDTYQWSARRQAKDLYIRLSYLGGTNQWRRDIKTPVQEDHPMVLAFGKEMKENAKRLLETHYPGWIPKIMELMKKKSRTIRDKYSTALSYLAQSYEYECLKAMLDYCSTKNLKVGAAIYDGIAMKGGSPEVLREMEEHIFKETKFVMKLEIKPYEIDPKWLLPHQPYYDEVPNIGILNDMSLKRTGYFSGVGIWNYDGCEFDFNDDTDKSVARSLSAFVKGEFVWDQDKMFKWNDYYWKQCDDGSSFYAVELRQIIVTTYMDHVIRARDLYHKHLRDINRENTDYKAPELNSIWKTSFASMNSERGKARIVAETRLFLTKTEPWNNLHDIIQFENCTWKVSVGFLAPDKSLYINKSNGVFLQEEVFDEDKAKLAKFMKDILPVDEDRHFILSWFCSSLFKGNKEQLALFAKGQGGNGKTLLVNLWTALLGTDCATLNMAYFTEKRRSGADSNLKGCADARSIIANELDHKESFNAGLFKDFTGGGKISTRTLYERKEQSFTPSKIIFTVNDMPEFKKFDDALKRRICMIPFTELFKTKAEMDPTNPHHHERDDSLGEWVVSPQAQRAFCEMLIDHMPLYLSQGLVRTQSMMNEETEYAHDQDEVGNWLTTALDKHEDARVLLMTTLCRAFNEENDKRYSPREFCSRLRMSPAWKDKLTKHNNNMCLRGWSIRPLQAQMIEDNE